MNNIHSGFRLFILLLTALVFFQEEAFGNYCGALTCAEPTTLAADEITKVSAKLNATVNLRCSNSETWFKWGTASGTYTNETPEDEKYLYVPEEGCDVKDGYTFSYSFTLPPVLTCETTYYYIAYSNTFNVGDRKGDELSFTTLDCTPDPPGVNTVGADAISETSATLNGSVNPKGAATTAWFK